MTAKSYCPDRGDIIWLEFDPQRGHEQAGTRPALTLSPIEYNQKTGLSILCPITKQVKNYPYEVAIPDGLGVQGIILADQIKNFDWRSRSSRFHCKLPHYVVSEVMNKLSTLLKWNLSESE